MAKQPKAKRPMVVTKANVTRILRDNGHERDKYNRSGGPGFWSSGFAFDDGNSPRELAVYFDSHIRESRGSAEAKASSYAGILENQFDVRVVMAAGRLPCKVVVLEKAVDGQRPLVRITRANVVMALKNAFFEQSGVRKRKNSWRRKGVAKQYISSGFRVSVKDGVAQVSFDPGDVNQASSISNYLAKYMPLLQGLFVVEPHDTYLAVKERMLDV